jgi:cell division protease FtsH
VRRLFRSALFYVVLALVVLFATTTILGGRDERKDLSLAGFERSLAEREVKSAEIVEGDSGGQVKGELDNGEEYVVDYPSEYADELTTKLLAADVDVAAKQEKENFWLSLLFSLLPVILIFGGFLFVINMMQGGGNRVMQFGKAKAKTVSKDQPKVTFADVAGADEAVAELHEIKEFLEAPAKFQAMGAKIPKGGP